MPADSAEPAEPAPIAEDAARGPLRLAVLLSGGGRTMVNLAGAIERGELEARIVCVISSRGDVGGVEQAGELGLPLHIVERKRFVSHEAFSQVVWPIIREARAELVCLAGFLSLLTIPPDYERRVINIHPALLPAHGGRGMYGHRVHEAVLAAGEKESGCTVHYCDNAYDTGEIILQRRCAVWPDDTPDTLAARVFQEECEAYPQAIGQLMSQLRAQSSTSPKAHG